MKILFLSCHSFLFNARMRIEYKKSGSGLITPDKHKSSRQEGCSLTFLADWLMTSRSTKTRRPVALSTLVHPVRRG
ncbi:hypothetical protein F7731_07010 [Cytobacillus depressus]|uniref:Uncharacterized protein n=1 Tax=Cytobacillus depressus TaxID=1602942 RepID=A0A6L3V7E3_9BACI|nr:hypothetical protein F7731_07010 [Cytobacillus depressus]